MLPAIATHAIDTYTQPGDLILDPMCGIGTTLVEAVHAGRDGIGVEYESRWADIADANITHAHHLGATGRGSVIRGDATALTSLLPAVLQGQVALVVTSPPYGPTVHGLVRPTPGEGVAKSDNRYGTDKGNLAYQDLPGLLEGFTGILRGCATLLRRYRRHVGRSRMARWNPYLLDQSSKSSAVPRGSRSVATRAQTIAAIASSSSGSSTVNCSTAACPAAWSEYAYCWAASSARNATASRSRVRPSSRASLMG